MRAVNVASDVDPNRLVRDVVRKLLANLAFARQKHEMLVGQG